MIALICKQISYKLESTFRVIIVETVASFSFPSLSMLISKTFMPKRTRETNGFILFLPAFSGQLPARREYAQTGLRTHARCHRYSIPQHVKVGHTTGVSDPYSFRRKWRDAVRASFMKRLCCVFRKCFNKL